MGHRPEVPKRRCPHCGRLRPLYLYESHVADCRRARAAARAAREAVEREINRALGFQANGLPCGAAAKD